MSRLFAPWTIATMIWLACCPVLSTCHAIDNPSVSFEETVAPFFDQYCQQCHRGDQSEAGLDLQNLATDFTDDASANRWVDVLHSLQFDQMPPQDEQRPNAIEKANVIAWIVQKMQETDRFEAYQKKLLAPEYGNWVSHEKLFSGKIETPPFSPARMWRFSPEIFAQRGFGNAKSPYTYVTSERGIRDYAAISITDQSTVQMMLIAADSFLSHRDKRGEFARFADDAPIPDDQTLKDVVAREYRRVIGRPPRDDERTKYVAFLKQNIKTGGNLDGLKTTIKAMFLSPESLYRMEFGLGDVDDHGRRHLSSNELAHAIAFALTDRTPEHNRYLRDALRDGKLSNQDDVARVVDLMLSNQITSGHWDRRDLPRVMRFFEEFFGFHRAGTVFKDNERRRREKIPQWNTAMLIHDARMLIEHVLKEDKDVIATLLTTNRYFVAHPGDNQYAREFYEERVAEVTDPNYVKDKVAQRRKQLERELKDWQLKKDEAERRLASYQKSEETRVKKYTTALAKGMYPHPSYPFTSKSRGIADLIYIEPYNLPSSNGVEEQKWDWPLEQPIELPKEQRAGLLTHPAWLAAHSLNEDNDPIRRGIWVYERLLAGVLGDVPPDVDAAVSSDPHKTLRERMEPLRSQRCWKCHRKINPLGEPFEMYDDWGRYRTHLFFDGNGEIYSRRDREFERRQEEGKLTARLIDAKGAIVGSGQSEVDGEVSSAVEMMHRLGRSDRARQSFIRHLFRYLMGRNEMLSDSQTLIEADQAYLQSGGSFKALVVSLLSSDSFVYRR